ncbi:MAG: hypothetical protein U1E78_09640 [Gammaproteobacteria bacterium]
MTQKNIKPEDYGINLKESLFSGRIIGLKRNSVAYRKGLRNDQTIINYKFQNDDNQQLDLEILAGETVKRYSLIRLGKSITIPQYEFDHEKYKQDPMLCNLETPFGHLLPDWEKD